MTPTVLAIADKTIERLKHENADLWNINRVLTERLAQAADDKEDLLGKCDLLTMQVQQLNAAMSDREIVAELRASELRCAVRRWKNRALLSVPVTVIAISIAVLAVAIR